MSDPTQAPSTDFTPALPKVAGKGSRRGRWGKGRVMKLVRRAHLYTGLVLLPWVIFFGFSGMLFNHPEFGSLEVLEQWSGSETSERGFAAPDAEALADQIVATLNGKGGSGSFRRAAAGDAKFDGEFVFQGEAPGGPVSVVIDPNSGGAHVHQVAAAPKPGVPEALKAFQADPPAIDKDDLQAFAEGLAKDAGVAPKGPLALSTRGGSELRFRLESVETGQRWNVAMNLAGGGLNAREAGKDGPDLYTALTRFHKTHHYPASMGPRWLWTAFADATGLTMVFWGISGAIMWWQIKPTRLLGITGLSVAGVLAFYIFAGTYSQLHWTPREARPPGGAAKGQGPGSGEARPAAEETPRPQNTPKEAPTP